MLNSFINFSFSSSGTKGEEGIFERKSNVFRHCLETLIGGRLISLPLRHPTRPDRRMWSGRGGLSWALATLTINRTVEQWKVTRRFNLRPE